jgi:outer membrane receptor protein involved in Fe transport
MKSLNKRHLSLAVSAALSTSLTSGFVFAQDSEEVVEEVLVTGTRIATQDGFGATSPVTVVNAATIQNLGFTNIEQVLNSLPSIETSQNANISNGSTGTASIDLRGLGTNRTLVLINGRRMQAGGAQTQAPDVSQIPVIALERVDVLTGGASATYGADAVAGVVNFVTRRMDGIEIRGGWSGYRHDNDNSYMQGLLDARGFDYPSGTEGPDGETFQLDIAMGADFADGRGNATIYGSWREQKELRQAARDYSSGALNAAATAVGGSATAPIPNLDFVPRIGTAANGSAEYDFDRVLETTLQPDGSVAPFTNNFYNFGPINHFLRPIEQYSVGAFVDYKINDHFTPYFETMFSSNSSRAQIAESGTFFAAFPFEADDLPSAVTASLDELYGESFDEYLVYVGKRNVEGGPRSDNTTHDAFRIVTGLKGDINETWSYDISYLYASTRSTSTYVNDFFLTKVAQAIDPDTCTGDCQLYDVFTPGGVTPEAANRLTGVGMLNGKTATEVLTGFVTGDLFTLPTASEPVKIVVGYEWRGEDYESIADSIFQDGLLLGQGGPTPTLEGAFNVAEFFTEASIPVLDTLILDLAYRYSDYSTVGGQDTYRIGFDWQAVDMARFRVGFNTAVRAPNVEELFSVNNLGLWSGVDPCAGATPEYSPEQCARTGVSASQYGNISASPASQYNQISGGNVNLDVEEADTITVGVVLDPIENLTISVDYWNIEIENTIAGIGAENIIRQCAENNNLCDSITRSAAGDLWRGESGFVFNGQQNIGTNKWEGVDIAATYVLDALGGTFNFNLIGTYMLTKEVEILPGEDYDCVGLLNTQCYPSPEWRHTATAVYDSNEWWAVTARWRHYGGLDYKFSDGTPGGADTIAQKQFEDGENYLDINATFRFWGDSELLVGINNVLDEEPPLVGGSLSDNANAIAGFYDTLGQYLFAQATFRF